MNCELAHVRQTRGFIIGKGSTHCRVGSDSITLRYPFSHWSQKHMAMGLIGRVLQDMFSRVVGNIRDLRTT